MGIHTRPQPSSEANRSKPLCDGPTTREKEYQLVGWVTCQRCHWNYHASKRQSVSLTTFQGIQRTDLMARTHHQCYIAVRAQITPIACHSHEYRRNRAGNRNRVMKGDILVWILQGAIEHRRRNRCVTSLRRHNIGSGTTHALISINLIIPQHNILSNVDAIRIRRRQGDVLYSRHSHWRE